MRLYLGWGENRLEKEKVVSLEDRVPKLKQKRKQKENRQLITFVFIFFMLLLVIIYLQTPLSKVSTIKVTGAINVSEETIKKLSGITNETSYWKIKEEEVMDKIKTHEQIKEVQIEKKLPSTVIIKVEEFKRVAYVLTDSVFYPILENGGFLEEEATLKVPDAPILREWDKPELIQNMAQQLEKLPSSITNSISEIHHTPVETDDEQITVYMNDGYEVVATISTFAKKMKSYPTIVSQLDPEIKGTIHLEVGSYFEAYNKEEKDQQEEEKVDNEENEN